MKKILFCTAIIGIMLSCGNQVHSTKVEQKPIEIPKTEAAISANYNRETAKALHDKACYKCHDLYKPKEYTDEQWVGIMKSMAPKANLNAEESALVLHYLTSEN